VNVNNPYAGCHGKFTILPVEHLKCVDDVLRSAWWIRHPAQPQWLADDPDKYFYYACKAGHGPFLKLVAPLPNRLCFKNDDAVAIICTACSALFPPGSGGSRMAIDHARKKHNSKQVHANGGIKRTPPPPGPGPQGPNGWYGNGPNGGGMNGGGMYGGGMFHGGTFGGGMYGNGGGWV